MKYQIYMKTPDALTSAISHAEGHPDVDLDNDETNYELVDQLYKQAEKWFRYRECVTLEIDTDAGTCVVLERGK